MDQFVTTGVEAGPEFIGTSAARVTRRANVSAHVARSPEVLKAVAIDHTSHLLQGMSYVSACLDLCLTSAGETRR